MSEAELRRVHDRLYRLETAMEDVELDLSEHGDPDAYRRAFEHLADAASDLVGLVIEPARQ